MAAVCQVTGAVPGFGHNISHSHRRTKRRFDPNVQKKTYYVPSLRRNVTLNVSRQGHQGDRRPRHRVRRQGPPGPWGEDLMAKQPGRPSDHQAPLDRRHRVHLRDPQEPPQRPRPPRAEEVRPGRPQARRIPRGALTMAKKSKIAQERAAQGHRRALRREAPRAEEGARRPGLAPTSSARPPASACRSCRATRRRSACAAATPSTAAPAVSSANSASPVYASATWLTGANCPASPSQAGKLSFGSCPGIPGSGPDTVPQAQTDPKR